MARTDDGEFELILGNRQLISVFLIVVILLGVFFAMGYIVGRNSAPLAANSNAKTIVVGHGPSKDGDQAASQTPPKDNATSTEKPPENPPQEKAETAKQEPPATPPAPEKKPPAVAEKKPEPPPENPAPASEGEAPAPGVYWQVAAAPRKEADVVAGAIRKKGLPVVLAQAPNTALFRVLVGPLADASAAANARTELENAGFKGFIRKKF